MVRPGHDLADRATGPIRALDGEGASALVIVGGDEHFAGRVENGHAARDQRAVERQGSCGAGGLGQGDIVGRSRGQRAD